MKTKSNFKSLLLVFMVILGNNLFAQDNVNQDEPGSRNIFIFSVYTGVSFTGFLGDTKDFADYMNISTGLNFEEKYRSFLVPAGISFSFNLSSWFTLKTDVLYSPKGAKFHDTFEVYGNNYGAEIKLCANYVEFPVMVEISAPVSSRSRFYLNGGIAPSYIVSSRLKTVVWVVDSTPDASDQEEDSEPWEDVNNSDFSYLFGLGFKSNNGFWGVRYSKGTRTVSSAGWNFINQTFTFILGINF